MSSRINNSWNLILCCDDCSLVQTESNDKEKFVCLDCMNEITPYTKGDEEVDFGFEPSEDLKKYHCPKHRSVLAAFEKPNNSIHQTIHHLGTGLHHCVWLSRSSHRTCSG